MDLLDSFLCDIYRYEFMEMRNSSLLRVCCILLWMVFIASTGFMSEIYLLAENPHTVEGCLILQEVVATGRRSHEVDCREDTLVAE